MHGEEHAPTPVSRLRARLIMIDFPRQQAGIVEPDQEVAVCDR